MEDKEQDRLNNLICCVKDIARESPSIPIQKPLKSKPTKRLKKKAIKSAATIVKIVCETLHPKASQTEIIELANESINELKSVINDQKNPLSETLKSIIEQYQNFGTKLIKRALLVEIVKQLNLLEVNRNVDKNITTYE